MKFIIIRHDSINYQDTLFPRWGYGPFLGTPPQIYILNPKPQANEL